MSVKVDKNKCQGCKQKEEALCVKHCPGDLMKIGNDNKAKIRNPADCWDCMVCIKTCPNNALETKLPYQLIDSHKASLHPKISNKKIIWKAEDVNGKKEVFESPIAHTN